MDNQDKSCNLIQTNSNLSSMKPSNNIKTIASKIFINIYEFSSIFKDEIVIFKKFRDEKKVNKQRLGKDGRNS